MAKIIKKTEFAGSGCLVQGIGIVIIFFSFSFFPFGTIIGGLLGLGLIAQGSQMSQKFRCSECGNPVVDKKVTMCPTCKATFS